MATNKKEYNRKYYHEVRKKKNKFETETNMNEGKSFKIPIYKKH